MAESWDIYSLYKAISSHTDICSLQKAVCYLHCLSHRDEWRTELCIYRWTPVTHQWWASWYLYIGHSYFTYIVTHDCYLSWTWRIWHTPRMPHAPWCLFHLIYTGLQFWYTSDPKQPATTTCMPQVRSASQSAHSQSDEAKLTCYILICMKKFAWNCGWPYILH